MNAWVYRSHSSIESGVTLVYWWLVTYIGLDPAAVGVIFGGPPESIPRRSARPESSWTASAANGPASARLYALIIQGFDRSTDRIDLDPAADRVTVSV